MNVVAEEEGSVKDIEYYIIRESREGVVSSKVEASLDSLLISEASLQSFDALK